MNISARRLSGGMLVALLLTVVVSGYLLRAGDLGVATGDGGSSFIVNYEKRYFDGSDWQAVDTEYESVVLDSSHFKTTIAPMTVTGPADVVTKSYVIDGIHKWFTGYNGYGTAVFQDSLGATAEVPALVGARIESMTDLILELEPTDYFAGAAIPLVPPSALQQLLNAGDVTVVGRGSLLGHAVTQYRLEDDYTTRDVWLTDIDGIRLKDQFINNDGTIIEQYAINLELDATVAPADVKAVVENGARQRSVRVVPFELEAVSQSDPEALVDDLSFVKAPEQDDMPSGYTISAPSYITGTSEIAPWHDASTFGDARRGWMVVHEVTGISGEEFVIVQALAGELLPINLPDYWPEELYIQLGEDSPVTDGGLYAEAVDAIIGEYYIADVFRTADEEELEVSASPLEYDYVVSTTHSTVIRILILGKAASSAQMLEIAGVFLPDPTIYEDDTSGTATSP